MTVFVRDQAISLVALWGYAVRRTVSVQFRLHGCTGAQLLQCFFQPLPYFRILLPYHEYSTLWGTQESPLITGFLLSAPAESLTLQQSLKAPLTTTIRSFDAGT